MTPAREPHFFGENAPIVCFCAYFDAPHCFLPHGSVFSSYAEFRVNLCCLRGVLVLG